MDFSRLKSITSCLSVFFVVAARAPNPANWRYRSSSQPRSDITRLGAIRCEGNMPEWQLNTGTQTELDIRSLSDFCADYNYGGSLLSGVDIRADFADDGVFCGWFLNPPRLLMTLRLDRPDLELISGGWRRWAVCMTKCTCKHVTISHEQALEAYNQNQQLELAQYEGEHLYVMSSNPLTPRSRDQHQANGAKIPMPIYMTEAGLLGAINPPNEALVFKGVYSGTERNQIRCEGDLPPWFPPENGPSYENLHSLCAASFLGGHPIINRGGACADPNVNNLAFQDDYTHPMLSVPFPNQRPYSLPAAWITAHGGIVGRGVELYCRVKCACALPNWKKKPNLPSSTFRGVGTIILEDDGTMKLKMAKGKKNTVTIITPAAIGQASSASQRCERSRTGATYCFSDVPPEVKAAMWEINEQQATTSPSQFEASNIDRRCGGQCSRPSDCGRPGESACRCIADIASAQRQNLPTKGTVFQIAFAICLYPLVSPRTRLNGRDTTGSEDYCLCNSTYVSSNCCGRSDGIVQQSEGGGWIELKNLVEN